MRSGARDDAHDMPVASQEPSREGPVEGGVDVTLIEETLAMSVRERLRQNDRMLAMVSQLRRAVGRARG
jgi:hypothetical protein